MGSLQKDFLQEFRENPLSDSPTSKGVNESLPNFPYFMTVGEIWRWRF